MAPDTLLLLADAVMLAHFALAAFIVLGLPLVWVGRWRGWAFVHSPWLRVLHLGAMGLVLAESLLGRLCPLTEWEWALRQAALRQGLPRTTFIGSWANRLFYLDLPDWAFTALYAGYFTLILFTALAVPIGRTAGAKAAGNG